MFKMFETTRFFILGKVIVHSFLEFPYLVNFISFNTIVCLRCYVEFGKYAVKRRHRGQGLAKHNGSAKII